MLDAIGSERTALLGSGEGGAPLALFASMYPNRTHGLIWWWPAAQSVWTPTTREEDTPDAMERELHAVRGLWGTRAYGRAWAEVNETSPVAVSFRPDLRRS